jgi:chorismate mutase
MEKDEQRLAGFRTKLDGIDEELVRLLGRRYAICREIADFKKAHRIPMMQSGRVEAVKARAAEIARANGVDPSFIRELYDLVIRESCRIEDEIIDGPAH